MKFSFYLHCLIAILSHVIITPYQILAPIASFLAILYAWSLVSRDKKTVWEAAVWTIFWLTVAGIALFPDLLEYLTHVTGVQKRENAVFVTSIGILFFVVFYLVMRLEALEQRQTRIVQKMALKKARLGDEDEEE